MHNIDSNISVQIALTVIRCRWNKMEQLVDDFPLTNTFAD